MLAFYEVTLLMGSLRADQLIFLPTSFQEVTDCNLVAFHLSFGFFLARTSEPVFISSTDAGENASNPVKFGNVSE